MRSQLIRFYLLLFITALGNAGNAGDLNETSKTANEAIPAISATIQVDVYYFYFQPRCQTCIDIEIFSKEAIESGFPEELRRGTVRWHAYDVDVKEVEHYWNDFHLETKSLVVVANENGKPLKWKNCEKVWDLVDRKPDFIKYVQDEVRAYLIN